MKKIRTGLVILAALMLAVTAAHAELPTIGGSGSGDLIVEGSTQYSGEQSSHTMMIYMIGSNLESEYGSASRDIMEIAQSGADFSKLNVVIAAGGASHWQELSIQAGEVGFGSIRRNPETGNTGLIWDKRVPGYISSVDMLSYFLQYAVSTFPAETYSLVFWNHGGGPMVGYGHDEVANNIFSLEQLNSALRNSPFSGQKLSWIGFDACLMGSYEVAAALEPFTDYIIASEETEPGNGWDYSFVGNPKMGRIAMNTICDYYAASLNGTGIPYTISVIDTYSLQFHVNMLLDVIFRQKMTDEMRTGLAQAAYNSCGFGLVTTNSTYDLYDLYDFVDKLCYFWQLDEHDTSVLKSLGRVVHYNLSNMQGANGLSFYFPLYTDPSALGAVNLYGKFGLSDTYRKYLQTAHAIAGVTGVGGGLTRTYDGRSRASTPTDLAEGETMYTWQMTEEQQKKLVMADYVILAPAADGQYELVRRGSGVTADENGLLSVSLSGYIECLPAAEADKPAYLTLIEKGNTEEETVWFIPAGLRQGDTQKKGSLQYFDRNGQRTIGQFVPDDGTGIPPKQLLTLEKDNVLTFRTLRYEPAFGEDGALLPFVKWAQTEAVSSREIRIEDGITPLVESVPVSAGDCFIQIIGADADGNWFGSPLMPFGASDDVTEEEE